MVRQEPGGGGTALERRVVELLQGELKQRFTFLHLLGRGASSLVFRVQNVVLQRHEALKVLLRESAEHAARFRREAQLVATLDHPSIATIYDFGENAGFLWYSMQLVEGPSLAQFLEANGPLEPRLVVQLALPLLDALEYAHGAGIVHRDVKPANIMLDQRFRPYLVDFGLARDVGGAELTQTGVAVGTPAYIAPEQAQGAPPDRRADIYSFALTLYELLSGRRPFPGDDPIRVVLARVTADPIPLAEQAPLCPPELAAAVMKGLERDPRKRFATAGEMAAALQLAAGTEEELVPPAPELLARARPAPVELATARTQFMRTMALPRWGPRRLPLYATVGAVVLAGGVYVVSRQLQVPPPDAPPVATPSAVGVGSPPSATAGSAPVLGGSPSPSPVPTVRPRP
ncbi:MAG: serine/threonine protein kinase [Thermoanaerobaculaceae bacterium]|nr:serine/threonine protein kinase [Thermoanaerobaculaceae bacterium]